MGKWSQTSYLIIPDLKSVFITVSVIMWSIALNVFLVTHVALLIVGIKLCRKMEFSDVNKKSAKQKALHYFVLHQNLGDLN